MELILVLTTALFFESNSNFFNTVEVQREDGHKWAALDKCREANPELPALVIEPGNGKSIVCYKLEK